MTTYTVTFSAPDGAEGVRALRRLLKYALRVCGLKCVELK